MGRAKNRDWIWDRLDDHAAAVLVFFPTDGGWRVNEVAATIKSPQRCSRATSSASETEAVSHEWDEVVSHE
jgi:hypothetical protein